MQHLKRQGTLPIKGVVFDFDGTLAELHLDFGLMKQRIGALAEAFLERRLSPNAKPALEWIEDLCLDIQARDPEAVPEFRSRCGVLITAMEMDAAKKGRLFPFALEILQDLAFRDIRLGVITRNCTAAVRVVFPDIDSHVQVFLAREDVSRVKPHPEHLLQAVQHMGLCPQETLMVGDHRIDIQTAQQAGTRSAAVSSGTLTEEELRAAGPDFFARDVSRLMHGLRESKILSIQ